MSGIISGAPSVALALDQTVGTATSSNSEYFVQHSGNCSSTGFNITSVSLAAGIWCVTGLISSACTNGTLVGYISGTTAALTNLSTVLNNGGTGELNQSGLVVTSVIKLTTTTTVYINAACNAADNGANSQGAVFATQIG